MPAWLIALLVRYVLPAAVEFFFAFVASLRAARADDPRLLEVVEQIVAGISRDHPDWTGEQKRSFAKGAIKSHAAALGKDLQDSLVNTLIELAHQKTMPSAEVAR